MQMLLARKLLGLTMGTMLLVGLFALLPATASAHSLNAQVASNAAKQSAACSAPDARTLCIAPTMESLCPGKQWYDDTSHDGHPVGWTYTYGSRHCLNVTWTASVDLKACTSAWIYIPAGHATGYAMYENGIHSEPVDQSKYGTGGVGEFVQIFEGLSLAGKTIRLTDMTDAYGDQGYHDAQLGWGKDSKYSLKVLCP